MKTKYLLPVLFMLVLAGCRKEQELVTPPPSNDNATGFGNTRKGPGTNEDFETGTKGSYAAANVTITTGSWYFDDALLGSLATDRKVGTKSARIVNTGSISMNFNMTGVSRVFIQHAVFGSDGSSKWQLFASDNSGASYVAVSDTITTSSTTLTTDSFTLNVAGNVRIKIKKLTGGGNRLNIDEVFFESFVTPADNDHMLIGNPSHAAFTTDSFNNYLMEKSFYKLSYNKTRATPNWVSWHLYQNDLDTTDRLNNFRQDSTLPAGWYRVGSTSYAGSGFDRGHNCPSADRTLSYASNSATFLMTNMIPQAPNHNEHTWNNMEAYIRAQLSGKEAYVIMGSYGIGGTGDNGYATTINSGKITVPASIWKVVVLIPDGNNDLSRIDTSARIIAVNIPNNNSVSTNWKLYRTSISTIEAATGYDILGNVSVLVKNYLKAKVDAL
jgi:endonuclease G